MAVSVLGEGVQDVQGQQQQQEGTAGEKEEKEEKEEEEEEEEEGEELGGHDVEEDRVRGAREWSNVRRPVERVRVATGELVEIRPSVRAAGLSLGLNPQTMKKWIQRAYVQEVRKGCVWRFSDDGAFVYEREREREREREKLRESARARERERGRKSM